MMSVHSPFGRRGRKRRENTSGKYFPKFCPINQTRNLSKIKKGDHASFKFPCLNFTLNKALGESPLCVVTWNIQCQAAEDFRKFLSEMPRGAAVREHSVSHCSCPRTPALSQLHFSPSKSLALGYRVNGKAKELLKSSREGRGGKDASEKLRLKTIYALKITLNYGRC